MAGWSRKYTPPEQLNGGVQYENGHNPTTDTFNVPANNAFYAAEVADNANTKADNTIADVERFKTQINQSSQNYQNETTARVNALAEQIVSKQGTLVSVNGRNVVRVLYENKDYYYIDTDGSKKLLPMDRYEKRLISRTISAAGIGEFVVPDGIASAIRVVLVGGGGNGGSGSSSGYMGGGGGSGYVTIATVTANAGEVINYTVGSHSTATVFGAHKANAGGSGKTGGDGRGGDGMAGGGGGEAPSSATDTTVGNGGNGSVYGGGGGGGYGGGVNSAGGNGGNGGTYGGGGGAGGYGSNYIANGGTGGQYGGNGGKRSAGSPGTNTIGLDLEYTGQGLGGSYTSDSNANSGGGGGYGGNGGNANGSYCGGGGGGFGGNGGNGISYAGGGGGGYGCNGSDAGVFNTDKTRGGGAGGGGGYSPYNYGGGGNGGYGSSIASSNGKYKPGDYGKDGAIILTYYQYVRIPAEE